MKTSICNIQVQVKIPVEFDEEGKPLGFIMNAIAPQLDNLTWNARPGYTTLDSLWMSPEEVEEHAKLLGPIDKSELGSLPHTQKEMDALLQAREENNGKDKTRGNYWLRRH